VIAPVNRRSNGDVLSLRLPPLRDRAEVLGAPSVEEEHLPPEICARPTRPTRSSWNRSRAGV